MSRTIFGNALIGLVLGLLVFLPRGFETLHALDKKAAVEPPRQSGNVPAWVQRMRNLKIWRIRLVPSYRQEVQFDDNLFLNDRGEGRGRESDLIITERPGARVEFSYKKANIRLDYQGEFKQYASHPELNTKTFGGDLRLDIDLGLEQDLIRLMKQKGRWFVRVTDEVTGRTDPIDLVDPELVARLENTFRSRTGLEFKRGEVYLEYSNRYLHVFNSDFKRVQNVEHKLKLGGKVEINPRWLAEAYISSGLIDFDRDTLSDQRFLEFVTRVRGTISPTLSTSVAVGYRRQEVSRTGNAGDTSGFSGLVFDTSLRWDLSQRTRLFIGAVRELQLSSVSNFKEATIGRVSVVHELIPQKLLARLRFEVNRQRSSDGPEGNDPRNTRFLAALKFDYKFRSWLVFDISYQYQQNSSNQDDGDFFQNLVTVGVNFKF